MFEESKQKAQQAKGKLAIIGEDIDFSHYRDEGEARPGVTSLAQMSDADQKDLAGVGIEVAETGRAGSYIQKDHSVIYTSVQQEGLEVMSITEALERHPWLEDYYWKAVAVDADKYTSRAELHREHGYFFRALPGARVKLPAQACLYLTQQGLIQDVHNIIIAEEDSELNIITGCSACSTVTSGMHIGISEFYIKKNARVSFTMIHNWAEDIAVRPRTGTIIEEGGLFLSNYICMRPVKSLQMYPTAYLNGERAVARYNSVLVGHPGSHLDVGARVILRGAESRAEIIARSISKGGEIFNRGHLVGETAGVKAHLECRGLMLEPRGMIYAVPELEARVDDLDMSHEAAIGKISEEEIEYLVSRGLSEDEATAAIVRGFLNVKIMGLPPELENEIQEAIALGESSLL